MPPTRPDWPTEPRPYVAYRIPGFPQPARSASPRDAWADMCRFLERAAVTYRDTGKDLVIGARRWSGELWGDRSDDLRLEWPAECTAADFDAAVRLAHERFGKPASRYDGARARQAGFEAEWVWLVPVAHAAEVLDFLERVPTCTGGEWAPVHASYSALIRLRDPDSGKLLPGQGKRYHPLISSVYVQLQRHSRAELGLVLPFAQPDDAAADYVVRLQEHAPVWLDPRYFDRMTPAPDGSRYERFRLPPDWIGLTPDGVLRLDATRSGIVPQQVKLPTRLEMAKAESKPDDAFAANYAAVEVALREHTAAAVVIRGPAGSSTRYLAEQAAERLGMPLRVLETHRERGSPKLGDAVQAAVAELGGGPGVLLLEIHPFAQRRTGARVLAEAATRAIEGVAIPPAVRVVLTECVDAGEETRAAERRSSVVRREGFATAEQQRFLSRQWARAANREVTVTRIPWERGEDEQRYGRGGHGA